MKAFKHTAIFVLAVVLTACGGNNQRTSSNEGNPLANTIDSLQQVVASRDSILNEVLITVSDISASLDEIKRQEGIVLKQSELNRPSKDKISEDLQMMSSILDSKRKQIASLEKLKAKLSSADAKILGLEKLIEQLNRQIEERDHVIKTLSANIDNLNETINNLNNEVTDLQIDKNRLSKLSAEQKAAAETKYYIVGKEKELIDNGILVRAKGLSRDIKINPNIDKNKLIKINMYDFKEIELSGKKAIVVGNFPTSTYKIESLSKKSVDKLVITDVESFWKDNSILVIALR